MIKSNIGKYIKKYRTESGLSQHDLAARMGISRQTISSWETDRTEPSIQDVQRLADIFGCKKSDLIGAYQAETDYNVQTIAELSKRLTDTQQRILIKYMQFLMTEQSSHD